jgi:hypothetical protein
MRVSPWLVGTFLLTSGCTSYESAYERSVTDYEPVYCYQSLGGVTCHRQPNHRDARRLVNYYGPAPSKYEPAEPTELAELAAPPEGGTAVRDAEPKVVAVRPGDVTTQAAMTPRGGATAKEGEATKVVYVREEGGDWRYYLPFLTVLFGAAQVAAAFLF